MKILTADSLSKRRTITIADLLIKAENEDWHGVQDCASDIREIDAQLEMLKILDSKAPIALHRKDGVTDWEFDEPRAVGKNLP